MAESVHKHPAAKELLKSGQPEMSFFWWDKLSEQMCKCRPDWFCEDCGIIVDLKTCQDASPEGFGKAIYNLGYHIQAAWYLKGVNQFSKATRFIFIAVEKESPHLVGVYELDFVSQVAGEDAAAELLARYVVCKNSDSWPGYGDEIQEISLPYYALPEDMR